MAAAQAAPHTAPVPLLQQPHGLPYTQQGHLPTEMGRAGHGGVHSSSEIHREAQGAPQGGRTCPLGTLPAAILPFPAAATTPASDTKENPGNNRLKRGTGKANQPKPSTPHPPQGRLPPLHQEHLCT